MEHTGKYRSLWAWLRKQSDDEVNLTFQAVEDILGFSLPASCRNHTAHWYSYGGSAVGRAIRDAEWRATTVNLTAETVTLRREHLRSTEIEIADELAERSVPDVLAGLLLRFAANHAMAVTNFERESSLPLAATHDAYAAVFADASSLSIAVDPADARRANERLGVRAQETNEATWHVVVRAPDVRGPESELAIYELICEAFERSDRGPRWVRGAPDRALARGSVCPTCHLEMPLSGVCGNCA